MTRNDDRPDLALAAPAPLLLAGLSALRRLPTRPPEFQGADFDAQFDAETLLYDGFRLPDGRVALLGPPLLNLRPAVEAMRVRAVPGGESCRFTLTELDRHARILVEAPPDARRLSIELGGGSAEIGIGESGADIFAGRRVLFTLSKNNHLPWIRDWIVFARDLHGADAVLFYDNGSDRYGAEDVLETIAGIPGIAAARVVRWPFRYGPQGLDARRFWDSDFCQHGAWEHARWRYLQKARSAQNADVDELVLSRSGRSIFAAAEADPFGLVRYGGRWVVGTQRSPLSPENPARRHADYDVVLRRREARKFGLIPFDAAGCPPKWTVVPTKCPPRAQWAVHAIRGWLPSARVSREFSYRHFREISDNWKYDRDDRPAFDPHIHEDDRLLLAHLERMGR